MFKLFLLLSFATLVLCDDLSCYDCDPNKTGRCEEPDKNNAKQTLCKDLQNGQESVGVRVFGRSHFLKTTLNPNQVNVEEKYVYDCIFMKYVPNPGSDTQKLPEGIYRGCVVREEREESDPCRFSIREILQQGNGTVTACSSCRDSLCNRGVPKGDETGGAASYSLSGIAMLSALVCFYVTEF